MNELRRMAYLQAMGIESYVSRGQLPGAAASRRLAIVPCGPAQPPVAAGAMSTHSTVPPLAAARQAGTRLPRIGNAPRADKEPAPVATAIPGAAVPRFSLAAIIAGGWLWLEELDGAPLATAQLQLIQAMAQALGRIVPDATATPADMARPGEARPGQARPEVAQFDWPIHNNQQLDLGEAAAQAGAAGFIGRKLEQHGCRGLVLLGRQCEARLALEQFGNLLVGRTASSAGILADPGLKKQAWLDLLSLAASL